ncbi:MAG: phage/plasmid primase, P4 family, partial [Arthrobacter sp.]
ETSESSIRSLARRYNGELTINGAKEVLDHLRGEAPWVTGCADRDLVAVDNGIFDYKAKKLLEFSPDYVFLVKTPVPFDPDAESPVIVMPDGEPWEVEEWTGSLSDDPQIVNLLWEVRGAVVRPGVRWHKAAFFYSEKGNNGKGTELQLERNLSGKWVNLPMNKFDKEFMLEPLIDAQAILTDENPVGSFNQDSANFKAVITNDAIMINRKHMRPVTCQFRGFMVQCINDLPRSKDKSESIYRRQLFIPFEKWFGGAERKYIKDDYLRRPEVLRYVLKRVLLDMPDYYELSEPDACKRLLAEHKVNNDPVREFWEEFEDRFLIDLLPVEFIYDLYVSWSDRTNSGGTKMKQRPFMKQIDVLAGSSDLWVREYELNGVDTRRYDASHINGCREPLVPEYELKRWSNRTYNFAGTSTHRELVQAPTQKLRGLVRRQGPGTALAGAASHDEA